ncbi:hypothetical protein AWH63_10600 [Marinobacter sp. C18]|uniref:hypothetical protein n=1 Tax=Marinobacter sp. C18 TaxID=1772288 RepID=UPI0009491148|nr:hypothetical protein [Marinobacter sp. C18]OLF81980.1 hypothetical protein AWH63_10600 [Marinobacter sp. C18]
MMKRVFSVVIILSVGCASNVIASEAGFPEIDLVAPAERESAEGCRNPVADAWTKEGGLDLSVMTKKVAESHQEAQQTDEYSDLPEYLREDH